MFGVSLLEQLNVDLKLGEEKHNPWCPELDNY